MKNIFSALLSIFSLLLIVSCSADDSSLLEGKLETRWYYWQTISYIDGEEIKDLYTHTPGCEKDYIEFKDDNKFGSVHFYGSNCDSTIFDADFERNGTQLTIIDGDVTKEYTIEVLIGNQLRLKERVGTGDAAYDKVTYFKIQ